MSRSRCTANLAAALAAQAGLLGVAVWLAGPAVPTTLGAWLRPHDPAASALAVATVVALTLGALSTAATATILTAPAIPALARLHRLHRFAPPNVRRWAPPVVAAAIAVASTGGPAAASGDDPVVRAPFTVAVAPDDPVVRAEPTETPNPSAVTTPPTTPPATTTPTSPTTSSTPAEPATTGESPSLPSGDTPAAETPAAEDNDRAAGPQRHEVVAGEHFWGIAEQHLRERLDREPSRRAVARYWAVVVAANRPTIRSGDPNLIFPGEIVVLPAV